MSDVLTLYGAPECCLCDDAFHVLTRMQATHDFTVEKVDISGNTELEARYRQEIPVGFLHGKKVFKYHVNVEFLNRRLKTREAIQ